jgi:hypothetical protein
MSFSAVEALLLYLPRQREAGTPEANNLQDVTAFAKPSWSRREECAAVLSKSTRTKPSHSYTSLWSMDQVLWRRCCHAGPLLKNPLH